MEEDEASLLGMNLVWIIVGVLAAVIIIAGVVYNVAKRAKGEKGVELESDFGSDADDDDEDNSENDEEGSEDESEAEDGNCELKSIKSHQ